MASKHWLLGGAALAAAALASTGASAKEGDCASLKALAKDKVHIDVAEDVKPDPVWPFPPSTFNMMAGPNAGAARPFCRVAGVIDPEIGFEVWLPPAAAWNGKLQNVGNGGYAGAFNYPAAYQALAAGYAAGTTDTGHKDDPKLGMGAMFDASWAVGHPERVVSHGKAAQHELAVISKALLAAYYGKPQDYAYFTGCSTGGRQGLTEAQLYPEDYDGIVAGAPANNWVRLETTAIWFAQNAPTHAPLEPPLIAALAAAATAKCDADDGVKDGIISLPESCGFDPAELACKSGEEAGVCLTPDQVASARLQHGRRTTAKGAALYPGRAWGTTFSGEAGPPAPAAATMTARMETKYRWSPETFDFDRDVPALEAELDPILSARNPDLTAFAARGGKIILYHGWADQLLSPYNTIDYVQSVKDRMGEARAHDFVRLYMEPGVMHCSGGAGPDTNDALAALEAWVEKGQAPTTLTAMKLPPGGGAPIMSRPLCDYPQVAVYDGKGDPNASASFACKAP